MPDVYHQFGSDLSLSPTGDLLSVDGPQLGRQRLLRRLLTNPGAYIWQLDYGGGIGAMVGNPATPDATAAVILGQASKEAAVLQSPPPKVTVTSDHTGVVVATIQYADAETGLIQVATVPAS